MSDLAGRDVRGLAASGSEAALSQLRGWRLDALVIVLMTLVVGAPAIFTDHAFAPDYVNHLWLVSVQERAISAHLHPTFFLNAPANGVFYPFFLYYGATLYGLAGLLAAILGGDVRLAYVLISLLAIASAYGGMVWLARILQVRNWRAHAPALVFVASAYYITNIYGRGAWPEFIATSMWPLVCASGLSVLRAPRVRGRAAAAFVISVCIVAGSHNITLVMGTLTVAIVAVLLLISLGRDALPSVGRLLLLIGFAAVAIGLDAWFLLPDLVHESDTSVSTVALYLSQATAFLNTPGNVLDPVRYSPPESGNPALFVQIPVLFLVWAVSAAPLLARRTAGRLRAAGLLIALLVAAMLAAITVAGIWNALPAIVREAQFPYRLNTYVTFAIAGLVIIACLAWQGLPAGARRGRVLTVSLITVIIASLVGCVWQLWVPRFPDPYASVSDVPLLAHRNPVTWYEPGNYHNITQPLISVPAGRSLTIDPRRIDSDAVTITVTPPAGTAPFITNIGGGPEAVSVSGGVRELGRNADDYEVLARTRSGAGPVRLRLRAAGGAIVLGRIISFVALAASLMLLAWGVARAWRLRGRGRSAPLNDV